MFDSALGEIHSLRLRRFGSGLACVLLHSQPGNPECAGVFEKARELGRRQKERVDRDD